MNHPTQKLLIWQWRLLLRERVVKIAVGLLLLACGYALYNGFTEANNQEQDLQASLEYQTELFEKSRKTLEEFEQKPSSAETQYSIPNAASTVKNELANFKAVLPPASAAPLAVGQSDLYPQAYYYRKYNDDSPSQAIIGGKSLSNVFPERLTGNPLRLLTGRFDLAFVILYIFPLIIIALGYNLLSAERESGILALTLAQPVTMQSLLFSKTFVRFTLIGTTAILVPLLALIFVSLTSSHSISLAQISIWFLATAAYGCFWFGLCVLVNLRTKSSAGNALTLAVIWLAIVIVIPILAGLAAQLIFPVPSSMVIADLERGFRTEAHDKASQSYNLLRTAFDTKFPRLPDEKAGSPRINNLRNTEKLAIPESDEMMNAYFNRHPQFRQNMTFGQLHFASQQARDEYIEEKLYPLLAESDQQSAKQETFVSFCGLISPAIFLQRIMNDVAGTGASRHKKFLGQFDEYVRERNEFFSNKVYQGQFIASTEINSIRKFAYVEETMSDVFQRIVIPMLFLLIIPIMLIYCSFIFSKNYKVS